jgi:hypothetical protein
MLVALLLLSVGVSVWRRKHAKSYQFGSLLALWLFPLAAAVPGHWWRFLLVWSCFSAVTGYLLRRVLTERPLQRDTPGLMYRYFSTVYHACSVSAVVSYGTFMAVMICFPPDRRPGVVVDVLIDVVFSALAYSIYFGVLIRDVAEIAAENVSAALGYLKKNDDDANAEAPPGMCALCGVYLPGWEEATGGVASRIGGSRASGSTGERAAGRDGTASSEAADPEGSGLGGDSEEEEEDVYAAEGDRSWGSGGGGSHHGSAFEEGSAAFFGAAPGRYFSRRALPQWMGGGGAAPKRHRISAVRTAAGEVFQLPCRHTFHSLCIKGWVLIGKRNSCPCCCERVELSSLTGKTILGRPSLLWAQMLSLVRYLVVWLPLLIAVTRFLLYEAGVKLPTPPIATNDAGAANASLLSPPSMPPLSNLPTADG